MAREGIEARSASLEADTLPLVQRGGVERQGVGEVGWRGQGVGRGGGGGGGQYTLIT